MPTKRSKSRSKSGSKSPKRLKSKKKSSPSPAKTSGAGKRPKSKEPKKSAIRVKESPLIQTKRISIKATQVSEGSLENILQQLGGNNSRASLTIHTRESRGRSLVRADRAEQPIHSHPPRPLRSNSANDLQQVTNTELLRAQTARKNSYRTNQREDQREDQRPEYKENVKISERTFAPRELFIGRDSEEFQEENIRTIQYEVVPPAKEFHQRASSEAPRDSRYAKDFKEVNNNRVLNQRNRNGSPDTVEDLLVRRLSRQNSAELRPTRQEQHDDQAHSSHEVHKYLPAQKYPTVQPAQQRKNVPESAVKSERPVEQATRSAQRPDQIPKKRSDQEQPKSTAATRDTTSRSDNAPRKQTDQAQPKPIPPRPEQTSRRPPPIPAQQKSSPPSSQESMPKPRRPPETVQQRAPIPKLPETLPRPYNLQQRQLEREEPKAKLQRHEILPENSSKQSDDIQETLTANVFYKGAAPHLVLYYDIMSPQARSCLMLICLLKLDVELRYTDIFKGDQLTDEYLKINPVHTVPTLVTDDMIFTDSHTILMYLCDNSTNPLAKQLYPQNYLIRLKIMNCLFFEAQVLYRRHSNFMTDIVRKEFANIDYAFHEKKILEAYETLNSFLKESRYLVGDALTIADISMVATISALDLMFPIDQYQNVWPELAKWFRSMRAIPMYRLNFAGVMKQSDVVEKYGKFEFTNKQ